MAKYLLGWSLSWKKNTEKKNRPLNLLKLPGKRSWKFPNIPDDFFRKKLKKLNLLQNLVS